MATLHDQICFGNKTSCEEWEANPFKKEKCKRCCFLFTDHSADCVTENHIKDYLACLNSKNPCNEVLPHTESMGALYLGGFRTLLESNVEKYNITKCVQTAIDLENFFAGWGVKLREMEKKGKIELLRLHWKDDGNQQLYKNNPWDTVIETLQWIHDNRKKGENVAVNCAQGKSRSSTIVVAYIMAIQNITPLEALTFVKTKRSLAEPNSWFMENLKLFHLSEELAALKERLCEANGHVQ